MQREGYKRQVLHLHFGPHQFLIKFLKTDSVGRFYIFRQGIPYLIYTSVVQELEGSYHQNLLCFCYVQKYHISCEFDKEKERIYLS